MNQLPLGKVFRRFLEVLKKTEKKLRKPFLWSKAIFFVTGLQIYKPFEIKFVE